MPELSCQTCGARVTWDEPIPRDSQCERCQTDLRCCRNCRHWDTHYSNECTETQADPVADKTRRNFCEFFYFSRAAFTGRPGAGRDRAAEARAKLDALFGGPAAPSKEKSVPGDTLTGGSVSGSEPGSAVPGDSSPSAADREAARKAEARAKLERLFARRQPEQGGAGSGE